MIVTDKTHGEMFAKRPGYQAIGERKLWNAVLSQAFRDATSDDPATGTELDWRERSRARKFLDGGGKWFRTVCEMAGHNPDAVHERWMAGKMVRQHLISDPEDKRKRRR